MNTNLHFSSASDEHSTPIEFFSDCQQTYGPFDLDPCATAKNAKAPAFFTRKDNGLDKMWFGRVWMNPPYGRTIGLWMQKALRESRRPEVELVVCLVPARTDTAWWHDYAMQGTITFIRGRLKFGNCENCAPFPSALVVFKKP